MNYNQFIPNANFSDFQFLLSSFSSSLFIIIIIIIISFFFFEILLDVSSNWSLSFFFFAQFCCLNSIGRLNWSLIMATE